MDGPRGYHFLVEGGAHREHASGGFLTDDPGSDGTISHVGARTGVDWAFGTGPARFTFGIWAHARLDVTPRYSTHYDYTAESWLSGDTYASTGSKELGGKGYAGLSLRFGADFIPKLGQ